MMKGVAADKVTHRTTERYELIADRWKTNAFFTIICKAFMKMLTIFC